MPVLLSRNSRSSSSSFFGCRVICIVQLGRLDYSTALRLQQRLVELRKEGRISDTLLLLEHTPVITLGRNAKRDNLVASEEQLAARGVEVIECDRGGDVTFHGAGQLVGYPIFDLRGFITPDGTRKTLGAVEYVRRLEEVLIRTCADCGVAATRLPGLTGVWTEVGVAQPPPAVPAKLAAIGVHISRGVTSHGFALNVNTDLSYFDLIVPCGITAKPVTSVEKELDSPLAMDDVAQSIARNFGLVFGRQVLWLETLDALLGHQVGVPMKLPKELREIAGDEEVFQA